MARKKKQSNADYEPEQLADDLENEVIDTEEESEDVEETQELELGTGSYNRICGLGPLGTSVAHCSWLFVTRMTMCCVTTYG